MRIPSGTQLGRALAAIAVLSMFALAAPAAADDGTASGGKPSIRGRGTTARSRVSVLPHGRSARGGHAPGATAVECPSCDPIAALDSLNFRKPLKIDNKWLPLEPGTQLVLQGVANRGGGLLAHNVIFTVTDLVKTIGGIRCVTVWDQDINEGVLVESELAFFAQDNAGNVWNLGEYPEEYENGVLIGAENTWIHGVEFARAGVMVPDNPQVGTPGFLQAIAPENDFWDCGMVHARAKGVQTCAPYKCFNDALTIHEWAPIEGCEEIQVKTYGKHTGVIQVGAIGDPEGETLVLIQVNHLRKEARAQANASALELDRRGPSINEIYATTQPAELVRHGHKHDDDDDDDDDEKDGDGDHRGDAHDDRAQLAQGTALPSRLFMAISPNPVTSTTGIEYGIAQDGLVELAIFDLAGRRVRSLVNRTVSAGTYRVQWDARDDGGNGVAAGVYFARLRIGPQLVRRTIVLAR